MNPADLTILVALWAGILSFLSPCVLPLVPAYLGQIAVVSVAGRESGRSSRWLALSHAVAYVLGFSLVFTILGATSSLVGGFLFGSLPALRTFGGILLVVLGLSLAGLLRIPTLDRIWRPLEAGATGSLASVSGTTAFAPAGGGGPGIGERLGGRLVTRRGGWLASFGLGVVFAVGWTPCVGITLGGILGLAINGSSGQAAVLLFAFSVGLGLPFILLALFLDRTTRIVRPLVAHGRAVSLIGGLLVVGIGLALVFDWLSWLARLFPAVPLGV